MQNTYDVIILGAGASGMTAAIAAHENGLSVGLFEKQNLVKKWASKMIDLWQ